MPSRSSPTGSLWSAVTMGAGRGGAAADSAVVAVVRDRRAFRLLAFAAVVISVNWAAYIWGVNNGRVVETSLGYFINPLVTVLMGVFILGERLRRLQWVAVGIAALAVVVLTVDYGRLPWIALVLAFSFGTYGLAKKQAGVGAVESLTVETARAGARSRRRTSPGWSPPAHSHFGAEGLGHALLFTTTGVVTAIPLLCFGAAAIRVPLVVLGLLQYLAPVIQFALGVLWFHEAMPPGAGSASAWSGWRWRSSPSRPSTTAAASCGSVADAPAPAERSRVGNPARGQPGVRRCGRRRCRRTTPARSAPSRARAR